ncbi:OstA-like protein [Niabella aquatica]
MANIKSGAPLRDTIKIIKSNTLSIQKENDSTTLTVLEGNVILQQGKTIFKADKAIKNDNLNTFEAWGHVHINDADTTNIYSDHLKYFGTTQIAHLDGNVKLTDGQATLTTPSLVYNMNTNIGVYKEGGKVVNKKSVITSKEGEYYSDIKDVFFKKNVVVTDPAYNIKTDSLQYNTGTQIATFITLTHIKDSARRSIDTREGYYNLRTGQAEFGQRPFINDDNKSTLNADKVYLDDNIARAEGNAIAVDSTRGTIIIANLIFQNRINEAILATQKPVMIIKQDNDSIYVAADTLFSARLSDLFETQTVPVNNESGTKNDINHIADTGEDSIIAVKEEVRNDTGAIKQKKSARPSDVFETQAAPLNGAPVAKNNADTTAASGKDSVVANTVITVKKDIRRDTTTVAQKKAATDSTDRYFEAFHHVRIYSDSMQAVSDSLFYSFKDSTFRLFKDPVVWGKDNQITGDTILLHTQNKKPHWMEAFKNGFMVNHIGSQAFNQISATRIDAFFIDGGLDSVRAKGTARCIYYLQDEDSAFTGINQSQCDIIDSYFQNKQLYKVAFRSQVEGTIYPISQKSPAEMKLDGFIWKEALRPKTKYELFE